MHADHLTTLTHTKRYTHQLNIRSNIKLKQTFVTPAVITNTNIQADAAVVPGCSVQATHYPADTAATTYKICDTHKHSSFRPDKQAVGSTAIHQTVACGGVVHVQLPMHGSCVC